jgi:hypothetical protein
MKEFSDPADQELLKARTDQEAEPEQTLRTLPDFLIDVALLTGCGTTTTRTTRTA